MTFPVDRPRARASDPTTSHRSAIETVHQLGDHQTRALEAVRQWGDQGATWKRVQAVTGITDVWKRLAELHAEGLIVVVGTERIPETGREAQVYALAEVGQRVLEAQGQLF